jgi:MprA protease rhombosortase-interaction domain-containing protein
MKEFLGGLQYPHWIMVAGALLATFGLIGFALRKNKGPNR